MGSDVVEHSHHGHHAPKLPPVPDYRIYKVEDVPRLVKLRDALARQGLKDPWIRNEVWRYSAHMKTPPSAAFKSLVFRGLKPGFLLAVGTIVLEKGYDYAFKKDDHHHSGDAHH
uniref:NADH dehydrogenase [ubiquinone] 1 beta subcomplex subunit 3 n=1 Tax=Amblyomma tuberculatum TaxID=48802 RepID=A0A6M2E510_9ACAR